VLWGRHEHVNCLLARPGKLLRTSSFFILSLSFRKFALSLSLSLSISLTHIHSYTHSLTHTLFLSLSLSLCHTHTQIVGSGKLIPLLIVGDKWKLSKVSSLLNLLENSIADLTFYNFCHRPLVAFSRSESSE